MRYLLPLSSALRIIMVNYIISKYCDQLLIKLKSSILFKTIVVFSKQAVKYFYRGKKE